MATAEAIIEALQLRLVIDEYGNKCYYNHEDQLHREFGPAIVYANGSKFWYLNGKEHRIDGPAIEWADSDKEWYLNGKRHKTDGPAVEYASGVKHWWVNGQCLTKEEFLSHPLCTIK